MFVVVCLVTKTTTFFHICLEFQLSIFSCTACGARHPTGQHALPCKQILFTELQNTFNIRQFSNLPAFHFNLSPIQTGTCDLILCTTKKQAMHCGHWSLLQHVSHLTATFLVCCSLTVCSNVSVGSNITCQALILGSNPTLSFFWQK